VYLTTVFDLPMLYNVERLTCGLGIQTDMEESGCGLC